MAFNLPRSIRFSGEGTEFLTPTSLQMEKMCEILAGKIIHSGEKYDWIIAIALSSWSYAPLLADLLSQRDKITSIRIQGTKDGVLLEMPIILQPLSVDVKNQTVLLFDWLTDKGKTFQTGLDHITHAGAKSIEIATLIRKTHSIHNPRFAVCKIPENVWVINPHAKNEAKTLLTKKWGEKEISSIEIKNRLDLLNIHV